MPEVKPIQFRTQTLNGETVVSVNHWPSRTAIATELIASTYIERPDEKHVVFNLTRQRALYRVAKDQTMPGCIVIDFVGES